MAAFFNPSIASNFTLSAFDNSITGNLPRRLKWEKSFTVGSEGFNDAQIIAARQNVFSKGILDKAVVSCHEDAYSKNPLSSLTSDTVADFSCRFTLTSNQNESKSIGTKLFDEQGPLNKIWSLFGISNPKDVKFENMSGAKWTFDAYPSNGSGSTKLPFIGQLNRIQCRDQATSKNAFDCLLTHFGVSTSRLSVNPAQIELSSHEDTQISSNFSNTLAKAKVSYFRNTLTTDPSTGYEKVTITHSASSLLPKWPQWKTPSSKEMLSLTLIPAGLAMTFYGCKFAKDAYDNPKLSNLRKVVGVTTGVVTACLGLIATTVPFNLSQN